MKNRARKHLIIRRVYRSKMFSHWGQFVNFGDLIAGIRDYKRRKEINRIAKEMGRLIRAPQDGKARRRKSAMFLESFPEIVFEYCKMTKRYIGHIPGIPSARATGENHEDVKEKLAQMVDMLS